MDQVGVSGGGGGGEEAASLAVQGANKPGAPPAQCRRRKRSSAEGEGAPHQDAAVQPRRCRPRFELQEPASTAQDRTSENETLLSIELSLPDDQLNTSINEEEEEEEEEDEDEDEELPSFLMQMAKKPPSIKEGAFVWCKLRKFPSWPAMVKSVNHKMKKASIMFIDEHVTDQKKKGFVVTLKTLKPFDCEEASQLVCTAKDKYEALIVWSLELIEDYRIRIACGSFTGSFIEYLAHDMSYPVRRKYPQVESEVLARPNEHSMIDVEESLSEQHQAEKETSRRSKRLLPDRSHAAYNRANEKLVHYIVTQRMVEQRLLAVISGQQQSRWLCSFLKRTLLVKNYLEDDEQLDQVYRYLQELLETAPAIDLCVANVKFLDRVGLVLDALLPEALIHAIAGMENISPEKAEEKYLKGRSISDREREEFESKIG